MADQSQPQTSGTQSGLVISDEVQQKFGPILELIKGSESMNDEERQYWINILPIMTPEQLKNLEDILGSEKKQLAAIDAKYSKETAQAADPASVADIEQKIRSRTEKRRQSEQENTTKEQTAEDEILAKIQSL